jgi:imidazolonepropionase
MQAVTLHGASALGMQATHGSISVGKAADLAVWRVQSPPELCYYLGNQPLAMLVKSGKIESLS